MLQLVELLDDKNAQDIVDSGGFYHRQCYQDVTNKETLNLASPSANKLKRGRPSLTNLIEENEERATCSVSTVREKPLYYMSKSRWATS